MGDPTLRSHMSVFARIAKTLDEADVVRDVDKSRLPSSTLKSAFWLWQIHTTYGAAKSLTRSLKPSSRKRFHPFPNASFEVCYVMLGGLVCSVPLAYFLRAMAPLRC